MEYYYFGLKKQLVETLKLYPSSSLECINELQLCLNIDGLPLFRSSRTNLWPILCVIRNLKPTNVFPVTLTSGESKPSDLEFLNEIVAELGCLLNEGLAFQDRIFQVNLQSVICDAPAKAMVKNIKLYSGYHGCDRCVQRGVWCGRMTYPEIAESRTDISFREMHYKEHHKGGVCPFTELPIHMVNCFPIDYMHQVCLGVTNRLLILFVKGPKAFKLSSGNISEISQRLLRFKPLIPSEFARKPRGLKDLEFWKATEYRQFLLYTGQFCLKGILKPEIYSHFLALSVSMCMLVNPTLNKTYNQFAHDLLLWFIRESHKIYGDEFMVYNVHSLAHVAEDAQIQGCLDQCAAWVIESYLQKLKILVRSGRKPVIQLVKRLQENSLATPTRTATPHKVTSKAPDNAFLLLNGKVCEIVDVLDKDITKEQKLRARVYKHKEPIFADPCDSRFINFCRANIHQSSLKEITRSSLANKCIVIDRGSYKVFLALLHDLEH